MRRRGTFFSKGLARLLPAALLILAQASQAAAVPSDLAVKAAFLPKFAGYVSWPPAAQPAAGAPVVLCVIGGDPFGRLADQATRGQQVARHPIQLRRLAGPSNAGGCHVAFVQGNAAQSTAAILDGLKSRPVLTVTDARAGPQRGMIHFVLHQGRVRFHVDDAAAARSGLAVSSRLLGIALTVSRRP